MIQVLIFYILLSLLIGLGISTVRQLNGKEKFELIKLIGYSTICGLIGLVVLILIVILF